MKIHFYGAARTVTGSCHMLSCANRHILIDCGMRQGADAKGVYGEAAFPFDAEKIDAVLLTHAHIDHSGLIPLLVKRGFKGRVVCTEATELLSTIMLPDSAHIQEQDAEWQTKKNLRAGKPPVEPLYTMQDAQAALSLFHGVGYGETIQLLPEVRVRFSDAGHLLGSSSIEIWGTEEGKTAKVVFSGDLGRSDRPILNDPVAVTEADYLIMESTYGDRNHEVSLEAAKETQLANIIRSSMARGGNLVIPSFAVGRTQELLYYIKRILKKGLVKGFENVPVYIDSPLGIQATKIYERCAQGYYDPEAMEMAKDGSPFDFPNLRIAQTADESKLINAETRPAIIISASGMCDAGRIRHHLKHNLYRADSTVLFAGYQAQGTLGRTLLEGKKKVKLFGEQVQVNATIEQVLGFSGHAGKDELIEWVRGMSKKPHKVFLVHGEPEALTSLGDGIRSLGYDVMIPDLGDGFDLTLDLPEQAELPKEEVVEISARARGYEIRQQLERILGILERSDQRRSPDMELKLAIMEADVASLAEKWDKIIG